MAYPYRDMSQAQIEQFLAAPRYAIVGTNRRDGPPLLSPVWYLHEDGALYISMSTASAKYRNLARDPRIALCIAGDPPDARSVTVYGTADVHFAGSGEWVHDCIWRLVRRYYDSDAAARKEFFSEDELEEVALVAVTPQRIIAQDYNG